MAEVKKDCFGYDKIRKKCRVLNGLYCEIEECKFYKTEKQLQKDRDKCKWDP